MVRVWHKLMKLQPLLRRLHRRDFFNLSSRISKAKGHIELCQQHLRDDFSDERREHMRVACENLKELLAWEDEYLKQMAWEEMHEKTETHQAPYPSISSSGDVFFHCCCLIAEAVLKGVLHRLKLSVPRLDWRQWAIRVTKGKTPLARARRRCLAAVVYSIWHERNSMIFSSQASGVNAVIKRILRFR
ncbi:hypothetical protein Dimus_019471 [Dionaea muscipula]